MKCNYIISLTIFIIYHLLYNYLPSYLAEIFKTYINEMRKDGQLKDSSRVV